MIYTASENLQWTGGEISQNNSIDNDIKNAQRTTSFSKGNLERYTPKQYNDYGWVATNEVLTGKELKKLYSQFARIKLNKEKNFKNKLGEYLIPVGDKYGSFDHLVYIKGTNKHPIIRQVVEITEQYRETAEYFVLEVMDYEATGNYYDAYEIVNSYEKEEVFNVHTALDYPSYSELKNEGRRGKDGVGTDGTDREGNNGTEHTKDSERKIQSENVGLKYSKRDRTLASKDAEGLFGDSEKKNPYSERGRDFYKDKTIYAYDFLVNQEPMVVLEVPNLSDIYTDGKIDKSKIVSAGKKNALAQDGSKSGTDDVVYVQNRYTGSSIEINNQSIKHGLGGKKNFVITNARLGMIIGDVIRNGIPINEITPSDGAVGTYALVAYAVSSAKKEFLVIAHIDVRKNKLVGFESVDSVHSIRGRIKKGSTTAVNSAQGLSEDNGTFSTSVISISDLLEFVNSTSQSLLSDDVLEHFGAQRSEDGFYYRKVLHQTRKTGTSARSLLANALESVAQNEIERDKLAKYKEKIDLLNKEEEKLRELNGQIHKLSFPEKGSKKDQQKINELRFKANETANRIQTLDKSLFTLEASAPLKQVLLREKKRHHAKIGNAYKITLFYSKDLFI